jgi:hypothetical protein
MGIHSFRIRFYIDGELDDDGNKVARTVCQLGDNPADALQRFDKRMNKNDDNYEIIGELEYASGKELHINQIRHILGKEPIYVQSNTKAWRTVG